MELVDKIAAGLETLGLDKYELRLEGNQAHVIAVADFFADKNTLQRQKYVMAAVREIITSGELHAVNIVTFTKDQYCLHCLAEGKEYTL